MAGTNLDAAVERKHSRVWSRSTTASCSPTSNNSPTDPNQGKGFVNAAKNNVRSRAVPRSKPTSPLKTLKNVKKPIRDVKSNARDCRRNGSIVTMKTPAASGRTQTLKAELFNSPGGTDYIITPGRHVICMNEFLASFDSEVSKNACPRMRGTCHYAESMYHKWLEAEKLIDPEVYMLSFADDSPMEQFRQMAIQSVFNYAVLNQLHQNTVHLSILNICRLIHARVIRLQEKTLTHELFSCTVIAALRNAIKVDETYEKSDRFRIDPEHVWRSSGFLTNCCKDRSVKRLNQIESECLSLLEKPADPPLAPEFLERYLAVGCWPENTDQYRDLGSFLLGMSLFAHGSGNLLRGIPGSKMAGAALVLAIKIINTDDKKRKWEFWPERLVRYTGYALEDLKPAIRGIAALLRKKPKCSSILEKYYTKWGGFDWD